MKPSGRPGIIVALLASLAAGCGQDTPPTAEPDTQPVRVTVMTVEPVQWAPRIQAFGTLESAEKVSISVDSSDLVSAVHFEEGQAVSAGQVLIELDQRKQQLRLEQAIADVTSARAQLEQAQSTYQRHRRLFERNVLSKEQLKQSEAAFATASARLQQTTAAEALARQEFKETTLISPVNGIVERRAVEAGQTVLPGQELGVIQVTDTLRVVTYVTEREVNSLQVGNIAPVTTPGAPGRVYEGRIELISSTANPETGNFTVKLTLSNADGLLREGMSARVDLKGMTIENALIVPRSALVDRKRRRVLFTAVDGRAVAVEPVLGLADAHRVRVLAGLSPGDRVVLNHLERIVPGKPLAPQPADKNAANGSSTDAP